MSEITQADLKQLDEVLDKRAAELLAPFQRPISTIYIDIDYLFDLKLGSLLLQTKGEEDYNYIKEHLADYENSKSIVVTESFPKLGITEEQVDCLIQDPMIGWQVATTAPRTQLFEKLWNLTTFVETNNRAKSNRVPIKFIINKRGAMIPPKMEHWIKSKIEQWDPNAKVIVTNYTTWEDVPDKLFDLIDVMFVYDLKDLFQIGTTATKRMVHLDEACMKKIVFAYRQHDPDIKPEDLDKALENFSILMSGMFLRFQYIRRKIQRS